VLISHVTEKSPAAKAGLSKGDIITELNGRPMTTVSQLRNTVASIAPQSRVNVTVHRDGKPRNIQVTIGELPTEATTSVEPSAPEAEATQQLGLRVAALTPQIAEELGFQGELKGVVVVAVAPGSIPERGALRQKDVIVSIGSTAINGVDDYREAASRLDLKSGVRLEVVRDGVSRFVFLKSSD
jgi:serine protease Do